MMFVPTSTMAMPLMGRKLCDQPPSARVGHGKF
jgi:hypothetical protein